MTKLAHSPLTDNIYVTSGNKKTDVTNDFIFCVIARWKGQSQVITDSETGEKFEVCVKEIKPIEHPETTLKL